MLILLILFPILCFDFWQGQIEFEINFYKFFPWHFALNFLFRILVNFRNLIFIISSIYVFTRGFFLLEKNVEVFALLLNSCYNLLYIINFVRIFIVNVWGVCRFSQTNHWIFLIASYYLFLKHQTLLYIQLQLISHH